VTFQRVRISLSSQKISKLRL